MPDQSLWRNREFLKLWIGQAISETGSHISREGIPLAAAMSLGASPFQMGVLSSTGAAAVLLFGLFAGAWADRLRKRPVMIAADLSRAALLATIPLAAFRHSLSMFQLYWVVAVGDMLNILFDASYQAYVPSLVKKDRMIEANSRLALSQSVAEVAGPGITGMLVTWLTAPIAIAWDAVSFLVSAVSIASIRREEIPSSPKGDTRIVQEIAEGLRFSWNNPYLRATLLFSAWSALFAGFFSGLYVYFTVKTLRLTPLVLGLLVSVGGVSNLAGAAWSETLLRRWGAGKCLIVSTLVLGVASFLPALAYGPMWSCAAILALGQLGDAAWPLRSVTLISMRQAIAPPNLLARINSSALMVFQGMLPFGALAGGALAQITGVRRTLLVAAAGFSLSVLWLAFSPIRKLDLQAKLSEIRTD